MKNAVLLIVAASLLGIIRLLWAADNTTLFIADWILLVAGFWQLITKGLPDGGNPQPVPDR